VEWSESGATYTPIGVVDPVRIAGTTVQRANLNNPDMIRSLGLMIGSAVSVVKRGEIIPKIEGLAPEGALDAALLPETKTEILFPQRCDSCGADLVDGGARLYCPNPLCPKRLHHRLEKWVSVLDIRELGEKLLRQLFDKGRLRQIADLYTLEAPELAALDRMGEISAAKVIRHIRGARELSLAAFVAGFDFDGVGETIMDKVAASGFDTLEKLRSATVEELAAVYGLGEISARTIVEGLAETREEMDRVLAAGIISIAAPLPSSALPLRGCSFCFTGELLSMKRKEAEERIKALGGSVKTSVVKDLSFLVTNNPESKSAKNVKARKLGVALIDEARFLELLKKPDSVGAAGEKQGELF
jgi:DNA ligase (NAD+)